MSAPQPIANRKPHNRAVLTFENDGKQTGLEGTVVDGAVIGLHVRTEWGTVRVDLQRRICELISPFLPAKPLGTFVDLRVEPTP